MLGDVRGPALKPVLGGASFDLVASCPPYYVLGRGGVNPTDEGRSLATRSTCRFPIWCGRPVACCATRGRFAVVYPTPRLPELFVALAEHGLSPTRLRAVHPHADEPGQRDARRSAEGARSNLVIDPPLHLRTRSQPSRGGGGDYTEEIKRILVTSRAAVARAQKSSRPCCCQSDRAAALPSSVVSRKSSGRSASESTVCRGHRPGPR